MGNTVRAEEPEMLRKHKLEKEEEDVIRRLGNSRQKYAESCKEGDRLRQELNNFPWRTHNKD